MNNKFKILVSTAFCMMIAYNLTYSRRYSFNWTCFYKLFVSYCPFLRKFCARKIAPKLTFRLAYEYGLLSPLNNATSSLFGKQPSLPCELLVNNVAQRLQAGQPHHLTILLVNGGGFEFTVGDKQKECTFGDTPLCSYDQLTNNPF